MATRRWAGGAAKVAQVSTYTVGGAYADGQVYTVTINGKAVSYTTVSGDTNNTGAATGLLAALRASAYPEFLEVTWTQSTTVITGTANTAGKPFTATSGATGTGTLTAATPTASSGPNYWSVAANWLEGAVPVSTDDVIVDGGPSILYGTDQNAVTLTSLRITPGFPATSQIGLPANTNPTSPGSGYPEYRTQRLKIGVTTLTIETTSQRVRIDLDTDQCTATIDGTGARPNALEHALDLIGVHASTVVRVNKGDVGFATGAGDAATIGTVDVAYRTSQNGDAAVELGRGLTLANLVQSGGTVLLSCAATTITKTGGTLTRNGTGAITTLHNRAGDVLDGGTGTITTLNQLASYTRQGLAALTVTNANLYKGSVTLDQFATIAWTNGPVLVGAHLAGPTSDPGPAPCWFNTGFNRTIGIT